MVAERVYSFFPLAYATSKVEHSRILYLIIVPATPVTYSTTEVVGAWNPCP